MQTTTQNGFLQRWGRTALVPIALVVGGCGSERGSGAPEEELAQPGVVMPVGPPDGPLMPVYEGTVLSCPTCDVEAALDDVVGDGQEDLSPHQMSLQVGGTAEAELRIERTLTLGEREGPNYMPGMGALSRHPDGRYFAWFINEPHTIRIFDASATLVDSIGRAGDGPGEYRFISHVVHADGDTLYVLDASSARITVLAPDRSLVSTTPIPLTSYSGLGYLGEHRFAFHAVVSSPPEIAGYPIHIINLDGEIERSFGIDVPAYRGDRPYSLRRKIAVGPSGLWVAHSARYRVELWDSNQELRVLEPVDWFQPYDRSPVIRTSRDRPPRVRIHMVHEDSTGRLWVALHVPDENWRDALTDRITPQGMGVLGVSDPDRYLDTLVEVLDLKSGRVLATARFDAHDFFFLGDGEAVTYREDHSGFPFFDVWQMDLIPTTERR